MRMQNLALTTLLISLSLGGIALTGAGCAGSPTRRSTGAYLDDKGITTRVKTALFRDPVVSGFDVHVNTFRGDVQLSGFVDNPEQKERAAAIAREIPGVQEVTNNLEVKPVAVGSPAPAVSGSSETVTQPLDRPAADAPRNLAPVRTTNPDLDRVPPATAYPLDRGLPRNLEIKAEHGKATLRGKVATEAEKQDIERRVREIPGIESVDNRLEVQSR